MIAWRLFDFVVGLIGLLALWPFFLLIGLWIKLESKGPVFFRQKRVGLHGRVFKIHKFRTMRLNAENEGFRVTAEGDSRISRAGRFLRRYKLDELPQLIDVVLGRMSLVGPRPEVPEYVACYPEDIRRKVLSVRPGITDRASILFRNESALLEQAADVERAYIEEILPVKGQLYLDYVETRTFRGDLKILFETLAALLRGRARLVRMLTFFALFEAISSVNS